MSKSTAEITVMSALPHAMEFTIADGKKLTIFGRPESQFVGENGLPLQGNQYGETPGVKKEDWEYIMDPKRYGAMHIFKSRVMFAADGKDEVKAKKRENKKVKSGLEQIDPETEANTTPKPKDED